MTNVITHQRALHQIPELGFNLPKTTAYVREQLKKLSCEVTEPAKSSICAFFDMGRANTVAYRADMDALPVEEKTGLSFSSAHPGKMHACGHDAHTAMLLSFAEELDALERTLPHNVLLIFEPSEETGGGALGICESDVLEKYAVLAIFALHMWPGLPAGRVATRKGPLMARTSEVDVVMHGKSAHIAKATDGADALFAATSALHDIYRMERDEIAPEVFRLLKFGRLEAGTVRNAVAASSRLEGSLRAFDDDTFFFLQQRVREIAEKAALESGCAAEVSYMNGYPPVINDEKLVSRALKLVGPREIELLPEPSMTGEDFAFFGQMVPAVMFFLGTGQDTALHAEGFSFDENALTSGVDLFKKLLHI